MAAYVWFLDWAGGMTGSDMDKNMIQFVSHGSMAQHVGQMKWIAQRDVLSEPIEQI